MLEQVLRHLNNWFLVEIHEGTFAVENGSIALPFLLNNQYFRICGSVFNDGLHQYPAADLTDETFTGTVWVLAVPKAVVLLAEDIAAWEEKNGEAVLSPYTSESFGGYSYTTACEEGAEFLNYQSLDTSMEARKAEKDGVTSVYSALVNQRVPIEYNDYFRDTETGITYRVTSNPEEKAAPRSAGATVRALKFFTAERKELPK